jgi:hypothetical protein
MVNLSGANHVRIVKYEIVRTTVRYRTLVKLKIPLRYEKQGFMAWHSL